MDDLVIVQGFQGVADLHEDGPYSLLWKVLSAAMRSLQLCKKVTISHQLSDYVEFRTFDERLIVPGGAVR